MEDEECIPASCNWYASGAATSFKNYFAFAARSFAFIYAEQEGRLRFLTSFQHGREKLMAVCLFDTGEGEIHNLYCATGSENGTVKLVDALKKDAIVLIGEHKKHVAKVVSVCSLSKEKIISADEKGIVVVWDHVNDNTRSWIPHQGNLFSLSVCPHNIDIVAIGYSNGHIVLCNPLQKTILQIYKHHLDEIHSLSWCLYDGDHISAWRNGIQMPGHLFASGSKDKSIKIFSSSSDQPLLTLSLPGRLPGYKGKRNDPSSKIRIWNTVLWSDKEALVSGTSSGDLLHWNLQTEKWQALSSGHSRIIFTLSPLESRKFVSTSLDRQIHLLDADKMQSISCLPTCGGFVYSMSYSNLDPFSIAYGVGDNMIRMWNTNSNDKYSTKLLWQKIQSKVTVVKFHPQKEGCLGFGTDDGHVGVYDTISDRCAISATHHKKTIYSLSWGPHCVLSGESRIDGWCLYSCGGEGVVHQHQLRSLQTIVTSISNIIKSSNKFITRLSNYTEISWNLEHDVVAIGCDNGLISIYSAPHLVNIGSINAHKKIINCIAWQSVDSDYQHERKCWLAAGSNETFFSISDCQKMIDDGLKDIEPFVILRGHSARITALSWSPHSTKLIASASYDGNVIIWDVANPAPLLKYDGHIGRVLCLVWSQVHENAIYSGGEDFCVRRWVTSRLPNSRKVMIKNLEKNLQNVDDEKPAIIVSEQKDTVSDTCEQSSESSPSNGSHGGEISVNGSHDDETSVNGSHVDETRQLDRIKKFSGFMKNILKENVEYNKPLMRVEKETLELNNEDNYSGKVVEAVKLPERKSKSSSSSKRRKLKSLFPLAAGSDQKDRTSRQEECIHLAEHLSGCSNELKPGTGDYVNLGLYGDRRSSYEMFQSEGHHHASADSGEQAIQLNAWQGNIVDGLTAALKEEKLTDLHVALSPLAGLDMWRKVCYQYAKQLSNVGQYHLAGTYYVTANACHDAIEMFSNQGMFREAIALAKVRLSSTDPILVNLYCDWAQKQMSEGAYENAVKCYLACGHYDDAINAAARKGDIASFMTAAKISSALDNKQSCQSYCARAVDMCMIKCDFETVKDILLIYQDTAVYKLYACVHEHLFIVARNDIQDLLPRKEINDNNQEVGAKAVSIKPFIISIIDKWNEACNVIDEETCKILKEFSGILMQETPQSSSDCEGVLLYISKTIAAGIYHFKIGLYNLAYLAFYKALSTATSLGWYKLTMTLFDCLFPDGLIDHDKQINLDKFTSNDVINPCDVSYQDIYGSIYAHYMFSWLYVTWWENGKNVIHAQFEKTQYSIMTLSGITHLIISPLHVNYQKKKQHMVELEQSLLELDMKQRLFIHLHQRTAVKPLKNKTNTSENEENKCNDNKTITEVVEDKNDSSYLKQAEEVSIKIKYLKKKFDCLSHDMESFPAVVKEIPYPDQNEVASVLCCFLKQCFKTKEKLDDPETFLAEDLIRWVRRNKIETQEPAGKLELQVVGKGLKPLQDGD